MFKKNEIGFQEFDWSKTKSNLPWDKKTGWVGILKHKKWSNKFHLALTDHSHMHRHSHLHHSNMNLYHIQEQHKKKSMIFSQKKSGKTIKLEQFNFQNWTPLMWVEPHRHKETVFNFQASQSPSVILFYSQNRTLPLWVKPNRHEETVFNFQNWTLLLKVEPRLH